MADDSDDWFKKEKLHFASQNGDIDNVRQLIAEGYPIDVFNDMGWTPLHCAVKGAHMDICAYLIEQGADVNAHCEKTIGETPLGLVAANCSYEMAKLLIDAGANPTIEGWMRLTALDRAKERKRPEGVRVYELLKKAAKRP